MDFYSMKRKQLQALCKKHQVPANLSNLEMANKLMELFKEGEDPLIQRLKKGQDENVSQTKSTNVLVNRKVKKVRFSPEHELIEFVRSRELKRRSRRNLVSSRDSSWPVEIVDSGEMNKENLNTLGRSTRSKKGAKVNEEKSGMKAVQCNDKNTNASAVEIFGNGELKEVDVDSSGKVMLSRGKMVAEGVKNASKRERKRLKDVDNRDEKAVDNFDSEELVQVTVEIPGRLTRSRAQQFSEASAVEDKRGRTVVKNIGVGNVALVRAETGKGLEENKKIAEVHMMIEPQVVLRRSKRKANKVADSEILNDCTTKHEVEIKGLRKTSRLLAADSGKDAESTGGEVNHGRREVQNIQEPIKEELRRSNRRKNVIESHEKCGTNELEAENVNRYSLRSSALQLEIVGKVYENDKKALQPTRVMRRSRRNTPSLKLVSADEEIDTNSAVENPEAEKHASKPCLVEKGCSNDQKNARRSRKSSSRRKSPGLVDGFGGDPIIHQKNKIMKRKRGPISGGDVVKTENDPCSVAQSIKESGRKKAVPAAATGKVADKRRRPCRLDDACIVDASSSHDSLGIKEPLSKDAKLSVIEVSESRSNLSFTNTSAKNIIADVGLTSSRKTHRKKQDVATVDSAGSSAMRLISGKELANSGTAASSRITELKTDSTVSKDQVSASNISDVEKRQSPLEFDFQELIEKNIVDMDKNNQTEDSSCINTIDNQVLPEGPNFSGNGGFAETGSSSHSLSPGDQTYIKTDLEVAKAEAGKRIQSSPSVVNHVSEFKGISVQENLDSDETVQANDIRSRTSCQHFDVDQLEASSNIQDNNDKDASSRAGEVATSEALESCIDHTHPKSALKLKVASSGMLRRREGDNMAEGNETFFYRYISSELAETDEDGQLNNHQIVGNQYSECVLDLSNGERSARIVPHHDTGISSVEYSDKQEMYKDSLAVAPIIICTKSSEINLKGGHEDNHIPQRERTCTDNFEIGTNDGGGSSKSEKSKCDEDRELSVSNLYDAEGRPGIMPQDKEIFSDEYSINEFDEQGMSHGSASVAPATMCNCTRDHETYPIAEGDEAYIYKDNLSELVEADEGKDDDEDFSVSNLFDSEKSARMTLQDRQIVPAGYSTKDFNEEVVFHDFAAVSTTFANCNWVKLSADSSNLQEVSPSGPDSVSKYQVKQPTSPLAKPTAVANTIQRQEGWCNESETAKGKTSQVIESSSTHEDGNDANSCKDKEDLAEECMTDVKISMENENQFKNLLVEQKESVLGEEPTHVQSSQIWTALDDDTAGLNDTSSEGTEIANLTISTNVSIANHGGSLTKMKKEEIEAESKSESAKTTNRSVVLPTNYKEVSHTESTIDREENQLKFLFATPIKIVASSNMDETYSHDRKLDRPVMSFMECFDTMKESAVTQNKSDQKVQDAGNELENGLCLGDPVSDINADVTYEELNEFESIELVNNSATVLPEAEYNNCGAYEEQLTENIGKCLKETNLLSEEEKEEKVIPLGTDNDSELIEKTTICPSVSPRNLDILKGCRDMLIESELLESLSCKSRVYNKSEVETAQSSEAAFELFGAGLQMSNVSENSHRLTACSEDGNILAETSIETFRGCLDAEEARIGSFDDQQDMIDKGTSPSLSSKVSPGYEQHTNTEVATFKSFSTGYNLCLEADNLPNSLEFESSTCKEGRKRDATAPNVDDVVAAAEHGSSVCGAVSGIVNSSAMHLRLRDHEHGDIEIREELTPVLNWEDGHEKMNCKDAEEKSIANAVEFSIQELHFEERVKVFNNDMVTTSDVVPVSGCNEILKESDVADTIKEYIDSESSLSVIFENSNASPPVDVLARTNEGTVREIGALYKHEEDTSERVLDSEGEDNKPSVDCSETESKELEEANLFIKPAPGSGKAVKSPARVDLIAPGSAVVKLDSQKQMESENGHSSSPKRLFSTTKKNARTILIHGTPGKLLTMADMKENAQTRRRSSNIGDFTTGRPAKRRALQDVQRK